MPAPREPHSITPAADASADAGDDPGGCPPGEAWVIQAILRRRPRGVGPAPVDAGDDAAVLEDGTVLSVDTLIEGVHFDGRLEAADVGWKALAVNVSDLGAMGCRPSWALLSLSLPESLDAAWVESFADGLGAALARWGTALVGGDTTRSPGPRAITVTVGGRCAAPVLRSGGRVGDDLWVSGVLGESAEGYFRGGGGLDWLRRPQPPVELGVVLGERGLAHAMMDLSDGLSRDLPRLCEASRLGAEIDPHRLPAGPSLRDMDDPLPFLVAFGEDYQLLFSAAPTDRDAVTAAADDVGVPVTRVGHLVEGSGARLLGRPWPAPRFDHFGARP